MCVFQSFNNLSGLYRSSAFKAGCTSWQYQRDAHTGWLNAFSMSAFKGLTALWENAPINKNFDNPAGCFVVMWSPLQKPGCIAEG